MLNLSFFSKYPLLTIPHFKTCSPNLQDLSFSTTSPICINPHFKQLAPSPIFAVFPIAQEWEILNIGILDFTIGDFEFSAFQMR